jgi:hypothetical protein
MRYDPEDKYYAECKTSRQHKVNKRLKRPRVIKPKSRGSNYITAAAVITSVPKNECSVFQKQTRTNQTEADFRKANREEVTVTATLFTGAVRGSYVLRFVHKNFIVSARKLTPGQRIRIDKGFFNFRPGRKSNEFWVKSFALTDDQAEQTPIASNSATTSHEQTEPEPHQDVDDALEELVADDTL